MNENNRDAFSVTLNAFIGSIRNSSRKESRQIGRARGGRSAGNSSQSGCSSSYSRFRSLWFESTALSRRVHTRSEISHVARYAAEASGAHGIPPRAIGVDRALRAARLFLCY